MNLKFIRLTTPEQFNVVPRHLFEGMDTRPAGPLDIVGVLAAADNKIKGFLWTVLNIMTGVFEIVHFSTDEEYDPAELLETFPGKYLKSESNGEIHIEPFNGDIASMVKIIKSWGEENKGQEIGIDIDQAVFINEIQRLSSGENSELFVATNGIVIGILGIEIFNSPIGKQRMANEKFWYVAPNHRGSIGIRLLKHGMKWAKEQGCSHVTLNASYLASDLHDGVCKLYEKMGMTKFETVYIKEL